MTPSLIEEEETKDSERKTQISAHNVLDKTAFVNRIFLAREAC